MKLFKSKKGFTLIELIIVIAILGILMTIALPALFSYLESAKDAVAKANIKTIESNLTYGINELNITGKNETLFAMDINQRPSANETKLLAHLNKTLTSTMQGKFGVVVETNVSSGAVGDYYIYYCYDGTFNWNKKGYTYHRGHDVEKGPMGIYPLDPDITNP